MSLIDDKKNVILPYKRFIKTDAYGSPQYAPPVDDECWLKNERLLVRDESGKEVVSESAIFTNLRVNPQDVFVIGGKNVRVIRVSDKTNLDGDFDHCEVRL